MKQFISFVFAGMFGGLITFSAIQYFSQENTIAKETSYEVSARPIKNVNIRAGQNSLPIDFTTAAEVSMPAVVHISTKSEGQEASNNPFRDFFGDGFRNPFDNGPRAGMGSGVIYSTDGYIITNNHVVEFANKVEVTLYDNRKFEAKIVGTDKKTDLAVLKIEADNLPNLRNGDSDNAKVGEWVLAVGNPFDLTSTVTAGIISAKGRSIQLLGGGDAIEAFIQTDAAVNPGNSGGALIDAQGRLLGINTAIATRTGVFQGYSFAIPINLVTRIVDDIIKFGSYQRAFLGINVSDLDSEYAEELEVDISQGVVVEKLFDGGSAQYSGLLPKDIIVQVDGRNVKSVPELQEIVGRAKVGETIKLMVNRRGEEMEMLVRLKAANNE